MALRPAEPPGNNPRGCRLATEGPPLNDDSYIAVTFQVADWFGGGAGDTIVVRTYPVNNSCSYPFELGGDYLVFASSTNGNLYTSRCTGTRPAASETALIRELQSARAGTSMADLFGSTYSHRLDATSAAGLTKVEALAGLVVTARSEHSEHETVTGPDGFYEFWRLPPGRHVITAEAPAGRHITQSHTLDVGFGTACRADFDVQYDVR